MLFGRAVTARCEPPDFGAVLRAVDRVGPGEVLVIAAGGVESHAMIGDVLGGHLRAKGAAGIVCDGAVRDTRQPRKLERLPRVLRRDHPARADGRDARRRQRTP